MPDRWNAAQCPGEMAADCRRGDPPRLDISASRVGPEAGVAGQSAGAAAPATPPLHERATLPPPQLPGGVRLLRHPLSQLAVAQAGRSRSQCHRQVLETSLQSRRGRFSAQYARETARRARPLPFVKPPPPPRLRPAGRAGSPHRETPVVQGRVHPLFGLPFCFATRSTGFPDHVARWQWPSPPA